MISLTIAVFKEINGQNVQIIVIVTMQCSTKQCVTRSAQTEIEREHDCRYSMLLRLPYIDPVRMCVIDPFAQSISWHSPSCDFYMERFDDKDLNVIQQKVNSFVTPDDVGRIPSKISSSFSGFTAE